MKPKWIPYEGIKGKLPPERKYVLVQQDEVPEQYRRSSVVVGYLRYAAGDKTSPQFIRPGAAIGEITHWCDCLGDSFNAPLWFGGESVL